MSHALPHTPQVQYFYLRILTLKPAFTPERLNAEQYSLVYLRIVLLEQYFLKALRDEKLRYEQLSAHLFL